MADEIISSLVREKDPERYFAAQFAPQTKRKELLAIYAFDLEIRKIRSEKLEPISKAIRLQWWREVIERQRDEEASGNPVSAILLVTFKQYSLIPQILLEYLNAVSQESETYNTDADLTDFCMKSHGNILRAVLQILGVDHDQNFNKWLEPLSILTEMSFAPKSFEMIAQSENPFLVGVETIKVEVFENNLDSARKAVRTLPTNFRPMLLHFAPLIRRLKKTLPVSTNAISLSMRGNHIIIWHLFWAARKWPCF